LKEIACFISSHGFGHATRTIAIIEALEKRHPDLHTHIFTRVPNPLFSETLTRYSYHSFLTDIGLEQKSALEIDIKKTDESLNKFLPFSAPLIQKLATLCSNCSCILCDIAPLGIDVADELGIPSILVENFTWDWIYAPHKDLKYHAQWLYKKFNQATFRIQTEPLCQQKTNHLTCGPIFRRCREEKIVVKQKIGADSRKVIMLTTGGVHQELPVWKKMHTMSEYFFLISGQKREERRGENILLLDSHTTFYHPDLIRCADLVICKAGYSTVAECFQTGTRVSAIGRDDFPESKILLNFLKKNLPGTSLSQNNFFNGSWLQTIDEILNLPRAKPATENGADRVADFLEPLLTKT